MIDFMYRSLFTGEIHEEGPSGRALVSQWILLSLIVGLVLASGEESLVVVFTCLFAAGTIALGVLWHAAWLGVVTRQPAAAHVRVLAAALWPLLLAGPVAALGRMWPGSTGLMATGLVGWMAIILFRGLARRVGTGLPGAAGALAGAVSLGFLAGTAILGAPILAIWLLASF